MALVIDVERCKGCGMCAAACPKKILAPDAEKLNRKGYNPMVRNDVSGCLYHHQ